MSEIDELMKYIEECRKWALEISDVMEKAVKKADELIEIINNVEDMRSRQVMFGVLVGHIRRRVKVMPMILCVILLRELICQILETEASGSLFADLVLASFGLSEEGGE